MIEAEGVRKSYGGQRVLDGASLVVRPGELALLIGSNGAGKSTLLRALAGVGSTDTGRIDIAGLGDPSRRPGARAALSCLPQTPAFHPQFTVRSLLAFYARLRRVDGARVVEVSRMAGLHDVRRKPTVALSGGLRQRLAIALLLLPRAPVLLLDEPGLSLDPEWRDRLCALLLEAARNGAAILVATHLPDEWRDRADRVLECRDGQVSDLSAAMREKDADRPSARAGGAAAGASPSGLEARAAQAEARRIRPPAPPNAPAAARALFLREVVSARLNRFLQVFGVLALLGGIGSSVAGETVEAVAALAFQAALYFTPVFALLLGTSSARTEQEEWPILFSQPMRRALVPLAKFAAGVAGFALLLVLLFLPPALVGVPPVTVLGLHLATVSLAAVFLALGLWCGFVCGDRARALLAAAVLWIVLFLFYDMAALALAGLPAVQRLPDVWTALLMLNPSDAFRIHLLFSLEQVPPESAAKSPLASWWIARSGAWLAILCAAWCVAALAAAARAVRRLSRAR